jgi:hypothetical protein
MSKKKVKKKIKCPNCGGSYSNIALHMRTCKKKGEKNTPTKTTKNSNTKDKKTTTKEETVKLHSDMTGLRNPQKYLDFISWIAIPDVLRAELELPATQKAYAEHVGVTQDTLVDWKKRAGFRDDVMELRSIFFTERAANVILALETKCLDPKSVSGNDVRVYLTAIGNYKERQEQEHKVHPDLQKALDKVAKVLPD